MTHDRVSAEHHAIARALADRGFRVIIGYGKGGFWVRNADMSRPPFVDERSFVSFARARKLCEKGHAPSRRHPRPERVQPSRSEDHGRLR
jgi:hypothetical protein